MSPQRNSPERAAMLADRRRDQLARGNARRMPRDWAYLCSLNRHTGKPHENRARGSTEDRRHTNERYEERYAA